MLKPKHHPFVSRGGATFELLEYWLSVGVAQDAMARRYLRSLDLHLADLYTRHLEDHGTLTGSALSHWVSNILEHFTLYLN